MRVGWFWACVPKKRGVVFCSPKPALTFAFRLAVEIVITARGAFSENENRDEYGGNPDAESNVIISVIACLLSIHLRLVGQ